MFELIRPTLFITARLGLFLALTMWLVNQWYYLEIETSCPGGNLRIVTDVDSVWFTVYPDPISWTTFAVEKRESGEWGGAFKTFQDRTERFQRKWVDGPFPGTIKDLNWRGEPMGFIVHYFLIVTVFVVLNVFLHWSYRKRGVI